ncbi:MAG: hypothetical protein EOO53_15240 [Gammaproteobacteria bacterium]|nr:MAG: hypothetical protein EOO53_15240 [Gammaproteobacteria bacterium]
MSDYILKFWPSEQVQEIKVDLIVEGLKNNGFLGKEIEFWGKPAFATGESFTKFVAPHIEPKNEYLNSLAILVNASDYGVISGEEDFEFIDRNNVVAINGGDDYLSNWAALCESLETITGNKYEGGWEIL